ncbi:hypothetical protein T484DRAFT_1877476 [Baffinella frigidus]|nr:hypothetical protein T484DRAFT_1877476 [Cryptophyta sp. CCMP2293]|mmetsp:Transcript_55576/g.131457  ORF Transcript_55576/g.131457 Transcript_55576/m.131457 type:complete len:362 (+) Transcript_55576:65-1150(+)
MAASAVSAASSCSHCGTQDVALKRCARCGQEAYCGVECQKAAWRGGHKKDCKAPQPQAPQPQAREETPLPDKFQRRMEIYQKVVASDNAKNWPGVLKWEGSMEELMEGQPDEICRGIIFMFMRAHSMEMLSESFFGRSYAVHEASSVRLGERHIALLGKMQRFRDQGEALHFIGDNFAIVARPREAVAYLERARKVAEAHGFFSVECMACTGLAEVALKEERNDEAVELFRNAVAAAPLEEEADARQYPLLHHAYRGLAKALTKTGALAEATAIAKQYREAAHAQSKREGRLCIDELTSLDTSAVVCQVGKEPQEEARHRRRMLALAHDTANAHLQEHPLLATLVRASAARLEALVAMGYV